MPRPKTEREALEEELSELSVQKENYQRELDATPVDPARHEWITWQIRRAEKRMVDLRVRLVKLAAG
jgi:predicted RNase H-like nuclease (RuvC/YqgF family)